MKLDRISLFALVAGDLGHIQDTFTTKSGREIKLLIYCDKGNESRCNHSMRSLKAAMRWDEETFGLEYDLDVYMIVAVDSFNMGAMENKGLNIFNASCALADEATATDTNFIWVEAVIGHEYFHNWTGNRVTCRDWFQLTLKEGLTVFREQEFTSDARSRPVKRVEDVLALRSRQFPEDAGPMAHPIQPSKYIQINNFYTSTVYSKGAEVIRMIHTLIGKEAFRKGMEKYFELYDGQAVTVNDFLNAMEIASGRELKQFRHWYHQAGTPHVAFSFDYDEKEKTFHMTVEQDCPATAHDTEEEKKPFHFPLHIGLLDKDGNDFPVENSLLEITQKRQTFSFKNIPHNPVPSINRNFSAPIQVDAPYSPEEYTFLMAHDNDPFNRWEAGNAFATQMLLSLEDAKTDPDANFVKAFGHLLDDEKLDKSLKALTLVLPSESTLADGQDIIDFDRNHHLRNHVTRYLATTYTKELHSLYAQYHARGPYSLDADAMGNRSLKNICLHYLVWNGAAEDLALCLEQFQKANNMTDQYAALSCLSQFDCPQREQALKEFYEQWKHDTLVMNKWLAVQAGSQLESTLDNVRILMKDPVFDIKVPNLIRALIGVFSQNLYHFHKSDGSGYSFLTDIILELDPINPQIAAGLSAAFKKFSHLDETRRPLMRQNLERIVNHKDLSNHTYEIVSKTLEEHGINKPAIAH